MKDSHHVAIVASGDLIPGQEIRDLIARHPIIYAADGGLDKLKALSLMPDLIVGDFDSVNPNTLSEYKTVETLKFDRDKSESDLELAVDIALSRGAKEITIYGGFLGRTDHFFANMLLLGKKVGSIYFESVEEWITAVTGVFEFKCKLGQIISFFSFDGPAKDVVTTGLKWDLNGENLDSNFFSLSNIAIKEDVTIKVGSGKLLLYLKK